MKGELGRINMVSEFAQYARLERRINLLTEDIKSKCMYDQWWIEKFMLGGRAKRRFGGCEPSGCAGGRVPAEGLGAKSPISCGVNAFCVMSTVFFVNTKI